MRLIKCYVENFGILHARSFNFKDGLNLFLDDNSAGKTTLSVFIKAMLYGIGDTRKTSIDENERKKYMPWQGGMYGGSLSFSLGSARYRIERSFGTRASDDTFVLYDEDKSRVSSDFGDNIGEEIFGIDRDGFERTIFLSEKTLSDKNENKSIAGKLSDLVGVDGDIGEFDNAIALLESKRRFYYKKGGSGEIARLKEAEREEALEYERACAAIDEARKKEAELLRLKCEIAEDEKRKLDLLEKIKNASQRKERAMYEKRYAEMKNELCEEEKKLASLRSFFREGIPSGEEIEYARESMRSSERLLLEMSSTPTLEKLTRLEGIFSDFTDKSEFQRMEKCAAEVEINNALIRQIDEEKDDASRKMQELFPTYVPKREQLVERATELEGRADEKTLLATCFGAFTVILFAILGTVANALLYLLMLPGAVLLSYGLYRFISLKERNTKTAKAFLEGIGENTVNPLTTLKKKLSDLDYYERLNEERLFEKKRLIGLNDALCDELDNFLIKFGITEGESYTERLGEARMMYAEYSALSSSQRGRENERASIIKRAEKERRDAEAFLSRFNTDTDAPFEEIRRHTSEYRLLEMAVSKLKSNCESFALTYGITGEEISGSEDSLDVSYTMEEIEELIHSKKREQALLENEYRELLSIGERRDEIKASRDLLKQDIREAESNLSYIQKCAEYLTEACDSITSKYIGKTKKYFEKYVETMTGKSGEDFSLDTSFTMMKSELGKTRQSASYSRGLKDLYALALRLGLVKSLYEKELPPLILDDPLIAFDDDNIERGKNLIRTLAKEHQILYFTCSKARSVN